MDEWHARYYGVRIFDAECGSCPRKVKTRLKLYSKTRTARVSDENGLNKSGEYLKWLLNVQFDAESGLSVLYGIIL